MRRKHHSRVISARIKFKIRGADKPGRRLLGWADRQIDFLIRDGPDNSDTQDSALPIDILFQHVGVVQCLGGSGAAGPLQLHQIGNPTPQQLIRCNPAEDRRRGTIDGHLLLDVATVGAMRREPQNDHRKDQQD